MYSRILVPLDGSQLSESILPYVRSLVKALKIPVELLQAVGRLVLGSVTDRVVRHSGHPVLVIRARKKRK